MNIEFIELNQTQTDQLKDIWGAQRTELKPDDFLFVKVKLGRPEARFTRNQLYRMTMTLAESGYEPIPIWLLDLLEVNK